MSKLYAVYDMKYYEQCIGVYERVDKRGKELLCSQEYFCEEAEKSNKKSSNTQIQRVFIPEESIKEKETEDDESMHI